MLHDEFELHSVSFVSFINIIILCNCAVELHCLNKEIPTVRKPQNNATKESDDNTSVFDITDSKFDTNILISPVLDPVLYVQINVDPEKQISFNTSGINSRKANSLNHNSLLHDDLPSNYFVSDTKDLLLKNINSKSTNDICTMLKQYLNTLLLSKYKFLEHSNSNITDSNHTAMNENNYLDNIINKNKKLSRTAQGSNTQMNDIKNIFNQISKNDRNEEINKNKRLTSRVIFKKFIRPLNNERADASVKQLILKAFGPERYDEPDIGSYNVYPLIYNKTKSCRTKYGANSDMKEQFYKKQSHLKRLKDETEDILNNYENNHKIQPEGISEIKNKTEEKQEPYSLSKENIDVNELVNDGSDNNSCNKKRNENCGSYNDDNLLQQINRQKYKRSYKNESKTKKEISCTDLDNYTILTNERNTQNHLNEENFNQSEVISNEQSFTNSQKEKNNNQVRTSELQIMNDENALVIYDKKFKNNFKKGISENNNLGESESQVDDTNTSLIPGGLQTNIINKYLNNLEADENSTPSNNDHKKYYNEDISRESCFTQPAVTKDNVENSLLPNKETDTSRLNNNPVQEFNGMNNDKNIYNNPDNRIKAKSNGNYDDPDEYDSWMDDNKNKTNFFKQKLAAPHKHKILTTRIIELINSKGTMGRTERRKGWDELGLTELTTYVNNMTTDLDRSVDNASNRNLLGHLMSTDSSVPMDQTADDGNNNSSDLIDDLNESKPQKLKKYFFNN